MERRAQTSSISPTSPRRGLAMSLESFSPLISLHPPESIQSVQVAFSSFSSALGKAVATYGPSIVTYIVIYMIVITIFSSVQRGSMFKPGGGGSLDPVKDVGTRLDDVAGCEYAKKEVADLIAFMNDPSEFDRMGAIMPRGILLYGAAGTGKTLLAKAVAGESNTPFLYQSGSSFVQMFVGLGASRVRELFKKARSFKKCIIFIDEIDAIGGTRGASVNSNDERDQTLNELLVQMDGIETSSQILIIGSTNRVDILDPALVRSGRFGRKIQLGLPDTTGRLQILNVHTRKVKLDDSVELNTLAEQTAGLSGADLADIVNEAAIIATVSKSESISNYHLHLAYEKKTIGLRIKPTGLGAETLHRRIVAIHEAGHALVGFHKNHDVVSKISIIATDRGAGGFTLFRPNVERVESGLYSKQYLLDHIDTLLAGRAAEEIVFGSDRVTTGASNDLERANELCKNIVSEYAMDEELLIGHEVDSRSSRMLKSRYRMTKTLIEENKDYLVDLADALIKLDELDADDVLDILTRPRRR